MRIFEPHIHMFSRTTDDYERMALAGIAGVLEPAFWLGQPRTSPATFKDYFDTLLGWERFRASQFGIRQFGIRHYCTMALNPKEANDDRLNQSVLDLVREYVKKEGVVGVGEIGFDDMTSKASLAVTAARSAARAWSSPSTENTFPAMTPAAWTGALGVARTVSILKNVRPIPICDFA